MSDMNQDLIWAFHEDHAVLGGGFGNLAAALRAGNAAKASKLACAINEKAGAHIAFEEDNFYPQLRKLLGEPEIDEFYLEHQIGFEVIRQLMSLKEGEAISPAVRRDLLSGAERMEQHIADCGELFQAMASLSAEAQAELLKRLYYWRAQTPSWQEVVERRERSANAP
jgi:hypothetical protein